MKKCEKCAAETKVLRRGMCNRCYENDRYRQKAYGRWELTMVDAEPVRAHVLGLIALEGSGRRKVARRAGLSYQQLRYLLDGSKGRPPLRRVSRKTAEAWLSVQPSDLVPAGEEFVCAVGAQRRLQALVAAGWSLELLAAAYARSQRWPLPFQWDEDSIDDPAAPPPASTLRLEPYRRRAAA